MLQKLKEIKSTYKTSVNILLIEDNILEAKLLQELLSESQTHSFNWFHVQRLSKALELLNSCHKNSSPYDIIFLDLSLPDSTELDSLQALTNQVNYLPIVVLTNTEDDQLAIKAINQGAQDYLVKRTVTYESLRRSLYYAIERKQIQEDLQKVNHQLKLSNQLLKEEIEQRKTIQKQLEVSNHELQHFAYMVSHDLKQPLFTISSWAQLLEIEFQNQLDIKAIKYIQHIVNGTQRMDQFIEDILNYSRVQNSKQELESTDCNQLIFLVKQFLAIAIETNNATITCDSLPIVMANSILLEKLFQNLIDNAIRYRKKTHNPKIHISANLEKDQNNHPFWQFSIRDNGIGIPQKCFDKIFMIFQRMHSSEEYPGNGIGLATCQKIVQLHRGKIWLESEVGKGSTFYFTIPETNHKSSLNQS